MFCVIYYGIRQIIAYFFNCNKYVLDNFHGIYAGGRIEVVNAACPYTVFNDEIK